MTDIIEVAKKCGVLSESVDATDSVFESIFYRTELQAFADHYCKEGYKERDRLLCDSIIATQNDVDGRLVCGVSDMLAEFNKRKAMASELRAKGEHDEL